jgi:hypothetical protein
MMVGGNTPEIGKNLRVDITKLSSQLKTESGSYPKAAEGCQDFSLDNFSVSRLLPVCPPIPILAKAKN